MTRDMSFAVHGISELSFAGAALALLFGLNIALGATLGSIVAAVIIAIMGSRAKDRNSIIAVLMPFGLGIGILALALYEGRAANKFGLLTGQIIAVDDPQVFWLIATSLVVVSALLVIWRPLSFASLDLEVAEATAVPTKTLGIVFMLLLALAVAASVQVVGALHTRSSFANLLNCGKKKTDEHSNDCNNNQKLNEREGITLHTLKVGHERTPKRKEG
jgi:zinc/manganese transport system permease protein